MRAMNLADTMIDRGHSVTIITSDFFHQEKAHRNIYHRSIAVSPKLSIHFIPSTGYKKNISISRFFDHFVLAWNLALLLISFGRNKPDLIFVGYPPIETSFVAILWSLFNHVPSVLDVKDLWPDLFLDSVGKHARMPAKVLLAPYYLMSRFSYHFATALSSMSDQYLARVAYVGRRQLSCNDKVNPLASRETEFSALEISNATEWWLAKKLSFDGRPTFIFVGSFMSVFDFNPIIEGIHRIDSMGYACQFVICGDGEYLPHVKNCLEDCKSCIVPGWISFPQLTVLANIASAALLPYKNIENYQLNVPNKAVDAMRFSLPIITPLTGKLSQLISEYKIGWTYPSHSSESLVDVIINILKHPSQLEEASSNIKSLYQSQYSYGSVYTNMAELLESMSI